MNKKYRAYFDYNVFNAISNENFEYKPSNNVDVFLSVSHVEEFYKAQCNDADNNNHEKLEQLKNLLVKIGKQGVILNPDTYRIIAKPERFADCMERVMKYDTRKPVEENGAYLYNISKKTANELIQKDKSVKNNSNLGAEEIWERDELKKNLSLFPSYYSGCSDIKEKFSKLSQYYNPSELKSLSRKLIYPKEFVLEKNCFKTGYPSYAVLECVIEFLNNILVECGYNKDSDKRHAISGIHDCSHIIYATYANCFFTLDKHLSKRAKAIYRYLGIPTMVVDTIEEYNGTIGEFNQN